MNLDLSLATQRPSGTYRLDSLASAGGNLHAEPLAKRSADEQPPLGSQVSQGGATPTSMEVAPPLGGVRTFEQALACLPGVRSVKMMEDGLHLATRSERDSKFLSSLLESSIAGRPVHFDAAPPAPKPTPQEPKEPKPTPQEPKPAPKPPKPELTDEEKAVRRYGKALGHLPHVLGVSADQEHGRVVIQVDEAASMGMLDAMIADTLRGVLVAFEAPMTHA